MAINPLINFAIGLPNQLSKTNSQVADTIASIATGNANTDVATTAIASQLASQVSTLRQTAGNSALASSLTDTAG